MEILGLEIEHRFVASERVSSPRPLQQLVHDAL
jgi:hypothetical protein